MSGNYGLILEINWLKVVRDLCFNWEYQEGFWYQCR